MMEDSEDSLIIAAGLSFLTVSASEEANRSHKTNSNDNTVSTTFSVDQASGFGDNTKYAGHRYNTDGSRK